MAKNSSNETWAQSHIKQAVRNLIVEVHLPGLMSEQEIVEYFTEQLSLEIHGQPDDEKQD